MTPGGTVLSYTVLACSGFAAWLLAATLLVVTVAGAAAAPAGELEAETSPILVSYSFDDDRVETGPDTFRTFENARGSVQLTDAFRTSGLYAVEIRDQAGDRDFPELQGYFPLRRDGILILHFALMVPDPRQELNVALAGPEGFRLGRDGLAFWLLTRDGYLLQVSDSIPKKVLELEPFTWYAIDAEYDLETGRYDLSITPERAGEPAVVLLSQPNAAAQPGSAVDKFSFIGDDGDDRSDVTYYVDEVMVASSREAAVGPFAAPGRRRFFVDRLELKPDKVEVERPGRARELAGDAAFAADLLDEARRRYQEALAAADDAGRRRLLLKLADVAWKTGAVDEERRLREAIFGSLISARDEDE